MKKIVVSIVLAGFSLVSISQSIPTWKITDVEQYIGNHKEEILVINFWATFCKPCIAELPSFIKITNQYKEQHVKLLLVSLDLPSFYPVKIEAFAKKYEFNVPIVWLDETNADYFCTKIDKKWSGSIPATLFINTKTGYRKFFEDEMDAATFEAALKKALDDNALMNNQEYLIDRVEPD